MNLRYHLRKRKGKFKGVVNSGGKLGEGIGIGSVVIAMVEILEDNSDKEFYRFLIKRVKGGKEFGDEPFKISHRKNIGGIYSGMPQFYEEPVYMMGE